MPPVAGLEAAAVRGKCGRSVQEAVRDLKREGNHEGKQPFAAVAEEKKRKKKRK